MLRALVPVMVAAAMITAGGGEALAASASTSELPKGFLLYEAKAAKPAKSWEKWEVSDSLGKRLELNPCARDVGRDGRRAMRTITYSAETDYLSEQVVIYRSTRAAGKALRAVRDELRRCARGGSGHDRYSYKWKKTGIGDEALRVGGFFFESRGRYLVVRRGSALAIYVRSGMVTKSLPSSQFRALEKDGRTMADKVCDLAHVCA
ncbi:hypothetical protein ACQP25_34880 [Microtetraspora malaysiensis]|uniref:hypothetical protein n=1 Tax=Microtetraspora malaysiensis TaxID=161358 RepID=UPI003D90C426